MRRVLAVVAASAIGVTAGVALAAGVGAVEPAQTPTASPNVTVTFVVHGDLKSIEGKLHDFNCVERVQPNSFRINAFEQLRVEVQSFNSPVCVKNEAIWLLTTQPKPAGDAPETMGVRLRYGARPTTVEFLHPSKDLRWASHVLSPTQVVVEITGK